MTSPRSTSPPSARARGSAGRHEPHASTRASAARRARAREAARPARAARRRWPGRSRRRSRARQAPGGHGSASGSGAVARRACTCASGPPEPAADREDEVGVAEAGRDRLVHRHTEHADVARRSVVDEVLTAKRAGDGQLVRLAEGEDVVAGLLRPAALADDEERRSAAARSSRSRATSSSDGVGCVISTGGESSTAVVSASTSSGSEHTGPGRPVSATENASSRCSGIRSARSTSQAAFAMPPKTRS